MPHDRPLAVVDVDGVLADVRHRLHHLERSPKDWDAFFRAAGEDPPLPAGLELARELARDHELVYLTGRPERCRADTEGWLSAHGLPAGRVLMRREGDRRPARLAKPALLARVAAGRQVALVVDDDPAVCAVLAEAGYRVRRADWMGRPESLGAAQELDGAT